MDVRPQIPAVIDTTEHPLCVRNKPEQSDAGAVRGRSIYRVAVIPARLDTHWAIGGDGVANSGLRPGWCHHHRVAEHPGRAQQRLKAGSVDAIVIAEQEPHRATLAGDGQLEIKLSVLG